MYSFSNRCYLKKGNQIGQFNIISTDTVSVQSCQSWIPFLVPDHFFSVNDNLQNHIVTFVPHLDTPRRTAQDQGTPLQTTWDCCKPVNSLFGGFSNKCQIRVWVKARFSKPDNFTSLTDAHRLKLKLKLKLALPWTQQPSKDGLRHCSLCLNGPVNNCKAEDNDDFQNRLFCFNWISYLIDSNR